MCRSACFRYKEAPPVFIGFTEPNCDKQPGGELRRRQQQHREGDRSEATEEIQHNRTCSESHWAGTPKQPFSKACADPISSADAQPRSMDHVRVTKYLSLPFSLITAHAANTANMSNYNVDVFRME